MLICSISRLNLAQERPSFLQYCIIETSLVLVYFLLALYTNYTIQVHFTRIHCVHTYFMYDCFCYTDSVGLILGGREMGLCVLLLACKRLLLHWRVRKACQKGNYDVAEFLLNWCYTKNEPLLAIDNGINCRLDY